MKRKESGTKIHLEDNSYSFSRADTNEALIRKIGDKISKFQEVMEIEKKVREETENVLFKLLEDIDYKFQNELTVFTRSFL